MVIAQREGCPGQMIRHGEYAYVFQAHMESTMKSLPVGLPQQGKIYRKTADCEEIIRK